jgi:hypothetical protein
VRRAPALASEGEQAARNEVITLCRNKHFRYTNNSSVSPQYLNDRKVSTPTSASLLEGLWLTHKSYNKYQLVDYTMHLRNLFHSSR